MQAVKDTDAAFGLAFGSALHRSQCRQNDHTIHSRNLHEVYFTTVVKDNSFEMEDDASSASKESPFVRSVRKTSASSNC